MIANEKSIVQLAIQIKNGIMKHINVSVKSTSVSSIISANVASTASGNGVERPSKID